MVGAFLALIALQAQPGPQIYLVGDAELVDGRVRLTAAARQRVGAAWFPEKRRVAAGFEVRFKFQLTEQGGLGPGADGFAFVLQNEGLDAIAGRGSAGGFALGDGVQDRSKPGIPRSIAVFFDTFRNDDGDDPSDNYIGLCTNGEIGRMRWPPRRLGVAKRLGVLLKDGREHIAVIRYDPPLITVSLDDRPPVLRAPVDLSTVVDSSGAAFIGFTASTGNGYENHDILGWSFTPVATSSDIFTVQSEITYHLPKACLEGRNLCTPPEVTIEQTAPGQYHVMLPAHLERGASIPNPHGASVTISNARGYVCWDASRCSGPEALSMRTADGRTWFSIRGGNFKTAEGYIEFDARLN